MSKLIFEKFPATIIENEHINKIRNPSALGIFCYLHCCNGKNTTQDIQDHFKMNLGQVSKGLSYLKDLNLID